MDHEDIYKAMQVSEWAGEIRLTAEQETSVLKSLKQALQAGVSLLQTWDGYGDLASYLNGRLFGAMRMRRLGSAHAWVAGGGTPYYHQASSLPVECAIALNAILLESKKVNPCISDYDRAETVANELARAIMPVGYEERDDGLWVERRRYMGLVSP